MSARDRARRLLFFTPHVSVPLALLGAFLVLASPVIVLVPFGWIAVPVGILGALALGLALRTRYRLAILDSSPLGVLTWLQRRR
jgi:hypothetical protein